MAADGEHPDDELPFIGITREQQRAALSLVDKLLAERNLDPDVQISALWLKWGLLKRRPAAATARAVAA